MKKILLIDESELFREYLSKKLERSFSVIHGINGLDGSIKMRNELPDLIILDYFLSRKSIVDLLTEKRNNPNLQKTEVIMISNRIDAEKVIEISSFNLRKVFTKPVKLDLLLKSISEILGVDIRIDDTPCRIEANFNEDMLFVEIAEGLNSEKIELLKYKIKELAGLYKVRNPKVLIMFSGIEIGVDDPVKLKKLFTIIIQHAQKNYRLIKVLSTHPGIGNFIKNTEEFRRIEVIDSLEKAMDTLIGLNPDNFAHDHVVQEKFLSKTSADSTDKESFELRFESEKGAEYVEEVKPEGIAKIAIIDDDFVIRELIRSVFEDSSWHTQTYADGKDFLEDTKNDCFDLIFLDILMPEVGGLEVLNSMRQKGIETPVIVFSSSGQKETIMESMRLGVHSYIKKPINPGALLLKAKAVLNRNF